MHLQMQIALVLMAAESVSGVAGRPVLGGRLGDLFGRKVTFLTGLLGFAGVSAIGGASVNFAMLVTARACQGAFAAILCRRHCPC